MPISKRGIYEDPIKSPYSFERYESDLERKMMVKLEADAEVVKWQKRHGITIPGLIPWDDDATIALTSWSNIPVAARC